MPTPTCKKTGPTRLEMVRLMPGPIERVWAYLTDGALRQTWFCGGSTAAEIGGDIVFDFDHRRISNQPPPEKYKEDAGRIVMTGTVRTYDPPHTLAFSWNESGGTSTSEVTIHLREKGGKVEVHLIHERLDDPSQHLGILAGWDAHFELLLDVLSGTTVRDFWLVFAALEAAHDARQSDPAA